MRGFDLGLTLETDRLKRATHSLGKTGSVLVWFPKSTPQNFLHPPLSRITQERKTDEKNQECTEYSLRIRFSAE